ncbi:MAG: hypothetical protein RIM83_05405 [Allomuricauda sp.]
MIFILSITGPERRLFFSDLFYMDSEAEVLESLYFLEKAKVTGQGQEFRVEISTVDDTIVSVGLDTLAGTQLLKAYK